MSPTVDAVFATDEPDQEQVRMTAWIRGRVQGVGMRWWVRSRALEAGLVGWALNLDDGRVEVVAEGDRDTCRELAELLAADPAAADPATPTRPGAITGLTLRLSPVRGVGPGFVER